MPNKKMLKSLLVLPTTRVSRTSMPTQASRTISGGG